MMSSVPTPRPGRCSSHIRDKRDPNLKGLAGWGDVWIRGLAEEQGMKKPQAFRSQNPCGILESFSNSALPDRDQ
jgi:hypothetical protein